jgi:hypothetical protein
MPLTCDDLARTAYWVSSPHSSPTAQISNIFVAAVLNSHSLAFPLIMDSRAKSQLNHNLAKGHMNRTVVLHRTTAAPGEPGRAQSLAAKIPVSLLVAMVHDPGNVSVTWGGWCPGAAISR